MPTYECALCTEIRIRTVRSYVRFIVNIITFILGLRTLDIVKTMEERQGSRPPGASKGTYTTIKP